MEKKKWYQSKIFLLAVAALATVGTNLANGWLSGQGVTTEQIDAVAATQPAVAEAIEKYQHGQGILQSIMTLSFAAIAVFRSWFTNKILQF